MRKGAGSLIGDPPHDTRAHLSRRLGGLNVVSVGVCALYIINIERIKHLDDVADVEELN